MHRHPSALGVVGRKEERIHLRPLQGHRLPALPQPGIPEPHAPVRQLSDPLLLQRATADLAVRAVVMRIVDGAGDRQAAVAPGRDAGAGAGASSGSVSNYSPGSGPSSSPLYLSGPKSRR